MAATLLALATASPPHVLPQDAVEAEARRLFGDRQRDFDRLAPVFANAGIRQRQSARPFAWFAQDHDWTSRTEAYLDGAEALFVAAAQKALDTAGMTADRIDAVVTVSSTGVAAPSLEARAARRIGFRLDVSRTPVFGLGCAGGTSGLSLAARLAEARPGSTVLLVAVELCTLSFRLDRPTPANIVATALFGDGAAACIVKAGREGRVTLEGAAEHTWPDTLDIMGWSVDPVGLGVIFDRAIPPFAEARFAGAVDAMLGKMGLERRQIDRFVCHPGGAKVIEALETALALKSGTLKEERAVLADHGNMSAPTVLFVLERVLAAGQTGRMLMTALGPGFTASGVSVRVGP